MRAFLIIALIVIMGLLYFNFAYSNVDLTPGASAQSALMPTPTLWSLWPTATPFPSNPPAAQLQGAPSQTQVQQAIPVTGNCVPGTVGCDYPANITTFVYPVYVTNAIPVTGIACTNPYVVQYGDWLSSISARCNTSVSEMLALNPFIFNPDLIFPGQVLWLFPPTATSTGNGVPVTGVVEPTPVPVQVNPVVLEPFAATLPGGTTVHVKVNQFPTNVPINIGIGHVGQGFQVVNQGITSATGGFETVVTIPDVPASQEQWVVIVVTTNGTLVQSQSKPFSITK